MVEGQVSLKRENLKVDLSDEAFKVDLSEDPLNVDHLSEEAQELPASQASATATTHTMPPLVSFRDVSLLSSLHQFKCVLACVFVKVLRNGILYQRDLLGKEYLRWEVQNVR